MEITLQQESLSFYSPVFTACTSQDCAAESVVPDRLPDVHRVLDTLASVYLRRRTVRPGEISLEGELRAVLLFQGEEDGELRKLDFELPCSFTIPAEDAREEDRLRARLSIGRAEGRIVNPRKLGVNVEVRAEVELYRANTAAITTGAESEELETLVQEETLRYAAELGEKSFTVIEECSLPAGRPGIRDILHARAEAQITDRKTVGGKCILQGNALWELRYLDEEGEAARERFTVPFSQLVDIPEDTGGVDVLLSAESAYAEILPSAGGAEEVSLELHLLAQTLCWGQKTMNVLSDVYSVRRSCQAETARLSLSAPAERLTLRGRLDSSLDVPERVAAVLWAGVLPSGPETADGSLSLPLRLAALCRTEEGELCAVRRSVSVSFPEAGNVDALLFEEPICAEPVLSPSGDRLELRASVELPALRLEETTIQYITGASLSEEMEASESAPSLVVLRPAGQSLWELAKRCRSTMALIRAANPENDGELLLIPRAR